MEYFDEEILKARKKAEEAEKARFSAQTVEKEKQQSIYDEYVELYQIPTKFAERPVLDGAASIYMPIDFELRPQEEIRLLYPLGNPPQELYGNSYSYFVVAFHWTQHQITQEDLPEFLPFAKQMMERMGPKARVIRTDIKKRSGGDIGIMEVVANAFQGVSYSYLFYTILKERLLMGTIMFDRKYKDRLLPIAAEIVESFSISEEGGTK